MTCSQTLNKKASRRSWSTFKFPIPSFSSGSGRSTTIFRTATTSFEEVVHRQNGYHGNGPSEGGADHLFTMRSEEDVIRVIDTKKKKKSIEE
ncbi:hypothetical protein Q0N12_11805 [Rossellomorea marisflavi]